MNTDRGSERWLNRWEEGKIGWHQERVNSRLKAHWPNMGVAKGGSVLVPLCGKSLDMLWLHQAGYSVVGAELSEIAVEAFFSENQLPYERRDTGNLQEFTGTGEAAGIRLLAGDFFELDVAQTGPLSGFFDRASLIALPPEMRQAYMDKLAAVMPGEAVGLLIGLSYDPSKMSGPPFSVPDEEVQSGFAPHFDISVLEHSSGPDKLGNLSDRGLDTMEESVYRLVRNATTVGQGSE